MNRQAGSTRRGGAFPQHHTGRKEKGTTIFLTTHNMMDADLLCDRVAFIADGNIKALGAPWKLKRENSSHLQEPTLEDVYMKYTGRGWNDAQDILFIVKKDFRLMLSSKFLLLAAGSLILYSCYINFVFVNTDQDIYPVYLYDPHNTQETVSENVVMAAGMDELKEACADGYAVGIDASGSSPEIYMVSSGVYSTDNYRAAWALSRLSPEHVTRADLIGTDSKEMKNRREITAEVLFLNWLLSVFWDWRPCCLRKTDGCDPGSRHTPGEYCGVYTVEVMHFPDV